MLKQGKLRNVVIPSNTTASEIVGPSERRTALIFLPNGTDSYFIGTESGGTITTMAKIMLNTGILYLRRDLHGSAVTDPWFGVAGTAGMTISYIEVLE